MEALGQILEAVEERGYTLIFFGTFLVDNSGIPFFIIAAGIMVALRKLNCFISFILVFLGLIAWDSLLYLVGIALKKFLKKKEIEKEKINNPFLSMLMRILNVGHTTFENNRKLFPLFCKIIPWIGKIAPIFAGYSGGATTSLIYFTLGDLWYASSFYLVALLMGTVVVKFSKLIGLLGFLVFLLLYYFSKRAVRKKLGYVGDQQ